MNKLTDEDFYDMTRKFLIETVSYKKERPDHVKKAISNLNEVAPKHALIIERYIRDLELLIGEK
jgi:hypothetical protein